MRLLRRLLRAWTLRRDRRNPLLPDDIPASLARFQVGEILPWKGTTFRVGKIVGGDYPVLILVPHRPTKGAALKALRTIRDDARALRKAAG